ncbi:Trans-aconitate 3-methyltransferase [Lasiodiplodia hormozganensis]|uniref:Trans-aconitate 3-methyltransferase n=1 Tax=Lasiodiplodia hormozganensis TaxID=869390 RepID=A0AA39TZH0_9PEZI|nr:Trans-aconitate 3-methyltransferase [Lasiodiplodia hormozganensis]
MADQLPPRPAPSGPNHDTTFRNYTAAAASAYASSRGSYPPALFAFILDRHQRTGGKLGRVLDVGCGPGNALRDIAPHFDHATGADPGEEMIATAKKLGHRTKTGEEVEWSVSGAEELVEKAGVETGTVDLLTVAMAAHWFDMPAFWKQAAQLVKPAGSVAIFTKSSYYCHPTMPNINEVQRISDEFERTELARYEYPGNRLCREFYKDLALPWQANDGGPPEFPEELFERHTWNVNGALDGPDGEDFFGGSLTLTFPQMEKLLGTTSTVQRWREAHPDLAGTDKDAIKVFLKKLEEVAGTSEMRVGMGYTLLFFKRK